LTKEDQPKLPPVTGAGVLRAGWAQTRRRRAPRKPTLAAVMKQVAKAGVEAARYEVEPDGKIVVVTGKPEAEQNDLDKWMAKHNAH
jgi:hypothetical protein